MQGKTKIRLAFGLLILFSFPVFAQEIVKKDTVMIRFSGQELIIPVPPSGDRTTVKFENKSDQLEISLFRKNLSTMTETSGTTQSPEPAESKAPVKTVRWFPQIETGFFKTLNYSFNPGPVMFDIGSAGIHSLTWSNGVTYPSGASLALTVKETERKPGNRDRFFVTGIKLFFGRSWMREEYYGLAQIQDSLVNYANEYRIIQNNFGVDFPFHYRFLWNRGAKFPVSLDLGVQLTTRLSWQRISIDYPDQFFFPANPPTSFSAGIQPFVSLTFGPVGLYGGIDLGLLSLSVNRSTADQAAYVGLLFRPFHKYK